MFQNFTAPLVSDPNINIVPLLDEILTPSLVMHGTADRQIVFQDALCIVERLPNAQLYAFEAKGHQPYLTATQEFCEVLLQFVDMGTVPLTAVDNGLRT